MQNKSYTFDKCALVLMATLLSAVCMLAAQLFAVTDAAWAVGSRHAIVVGEQNYSGSDYLRGPLNDASRMTAALTQLEGDPYDVVTLTDTSKSKVLSAIRALQPGGSRAASASDITLFYYSGHGVCGSTSGSDRNGALCCMDSSGNLSVSQFITPKELAAELGKVRGRIIILLDSCYSGQHVVYAQGAGITLKSVDDGEGATEVTAEPADEAAEEAVDELFAAFQDESLDLAEMAPASSEGDGISLMASESKFYLMTSSSRTAQSMTFSMTREGKRTYFGLFTYQVLASGGFDYIASKFEDEIPADKNNDRLVTMSEAYARTASQVEKYAPNMNSQAFPKSSGLVIFDRTAEGAAAVDLTPERSSIPSLKAQTTAVAKPLATVIKKIKPAVRQFTVKWKKAANSTAAGYQVRWSVKKSMAGAKKKTVKGASTTSLKVKNLKKGKIYYVQVRTYKVSNGTKIYSSWSAKKSVRVK